MYLVHSTIASGSEYFNIKFYPSMRSVTIATDKGFSAVRDINALEVVLFDLDSKKKILVSYIEFRDACSFKKVFGVFRSYIEFAETFEGVTIPESLYHVSELIDYVGVKSVLRKRTISLFNCKDALIVSGVEYDGAFIRTFSMGDRYLNFHTPAFISRALLELLAFSKEDFDTFVTIEGDDLYLKGYKHVASSSNLVFKLNKIYHFKVHDWTKIKAMLAAHCLMRG